MKKFLMFAAVVGLAVSLSAQNLAELARKEKARREAFKGRHAPVVTIADILRVQKTPAVEVTPPEADLPETLAGEEAGVAAGTVPPDTPTGALPAGAEPASGRRVIPSVAPAGPVIAGEAGRPDLGPTGGALEAQLNAAKELVDLLTTKMAALRQQLEYQDAMVPGYVIQQQLDETNQRLLRAQAQQARIEAQIAKKAAARKASSEIER